MTQLAEKPKQTLIPRTLRENLLFRVDFHQGCEQSFEAKKNAIALFRKDITSFFDLCLFTYDPRKTPADRPFILYPYQADHVRIVDHHIEIGESLLTDKSRDMGVTWDDLGIILRRFLLFDEHFLVGSRVADLVDKIGDIDSLFERLRYMLKTMPEWILDACGFDTKNSAYMKMWKENGASITGESMNKNFSRQGRYKAILLDEFAFIDQAEAIWRGCGDSAPCKLPVSTPNGSHNTFARLRKSGQIKVVTLHWSQHPEKTQEWYDHQVATRPTKDIAQELDINYSISAGSPFYIGFKRHLHVPSFPLRAIEGKDLLLGWDFGFIHPCCVITQITAKGHWDILDCILGENEQIEDFGRKVMTFLNLTFKGSTIKNYGDPAGQQESDKSKLTSVQILNTVGFKNMVSRPSNTPQSNYSGRKNIIEPKLKTLIDGSPAIRVNDIERCHIIIEAFEGGYRSANPNKYGHVPESPVRDSYYEHPMNALEYIAVNVFTPIPPQKKKKKTRIIPQSWGNI